MVAPNCDIDSRQRPSDTHQHLPGSDMPPIPDLRMWIGCMTDMCCICMPLAEQAWALGAHHARELVLLNQMPILP